jgi:DNA-directed RNA polymerase subunit RPC12/RpoP
MEKYVKLEDVLNILKTHRINTRLAEVAQALEHCTGHIKRLYTIEVVEPALEAEWVPTYEGFLGTDYQCSNCGDLADEGNSGHHNMLSEFCPHCGRKMMRRVNYGND